MKILKEIKVKKEKQNLVLKHIKAITNLKNATCKNAKILTKSPNTIIVMLIALIISAIAINGNFAAFAKYAMSINKTVQVNFAETTKYYENQTTSAQYHDLQTAVDEATSGDAIKVINTAILNQVITIPTNKEITIDLNSYTISGENTITNNGTLKIIDTSVAGTGAITSTANSGISNSSGATLTIGTNDTTISTVSPIITGYTYGVYNQGILNYYDGILQGKTASYYGTINDTPTEYCNSTRSVNNYYVTILKIIIAQIGEKKYETLTEAIATVPTDGTQTTITMVSNTDVTEESITIDASKNILLDLKGKTITSTTTTITNNGTLEVKDSSSGGTINSTSSTAINNEGTLAITGGTVNAEYVGICGNSGTVTIGIDDGTVSTTTPVITGLVVGITGDYVNIYDGIIKGTDDAILGGVSDIPSGYTITTSNDGTYNTATLQESTTPIARIGTTEYVSLIEAINAVSTTNVQTQITMLSDVSGIGYNIPSGKNILLDLNGKTITSAYFTIRNNGTLEVKDSSSDETGIISTTADSTSAIYNSNEAIFKLTSGAISGSIIAIKNNGTVTIGTNDGTVNTASPMISGYYGIEINVGTVNFYDGTIRGKVSDIYDGTIATIPDLYNINKTTSTDSEGYYSATLTTNYKAKIGTTGYSTLTEAIAAVPTDGTETTIVMLNNTSSTTYTIASGQNVILDLNGKTITSTGNTITNNGILEVKDSSTDGAIGTTSSSSSYYAIYNASAATFKLTSGTISGIYRAIENYQTGTTTIAGGSVTVTGSSSGTYAIYNNGTSSYEGTLNIIGGTITSGYYGIYNNYSSLVIGSNDSTVSSTSPVISGGTYGIYTKSGTVSFYDGTIKGKVSDIYDGTIATIPDLYNINKTTSTDSEGYYSATLTTNYNAKIGTTGYSTLTEAIAAVPTDGTETTIVMLNNTSSTTYTIASGQNVILDLNGKTITSTGTTIRNNGTLEVKDSSTDGAITTTSSSSSYYAIYNASAATFKLTSGTISGTYRAIENYQTGTTTIAGGTVSVTGTSSATYAIYNQGTSSTIGTLNITGGSITSGYYGIYNYYSTLSITGGTITSGYYGISNHYSSLVIGSNDSTVSSTSPVISGGTYGIYNYGTVMFYDGIIKGTDYTIRGVVSDIPSGYTITTSNDGTYNTATLQESTTPVARIGTTEYVSLIEAINAVSTTNVQTQITMLSDVSGIEYVIPSGKNILLDLNGKTITSTGTTITNNGTLEVKDSSTGGIISTTSSSHYAIYNASAATFKLTSGTITSRYYGIYNFGTITIGINDGIVTSDSPVIAGKYGIYGNSGTVMFYDGTIKGTDYTIRGEVSDIPSGYTITTSNDGTYNTATLQESTTPVARIGTTEYVSLIEAINAVLTTNIQTQITMLSDVSGIEYVIPSGKNILLDLNGKTITSTGTTITNNGILEVKDSSTDGAIGTTSSSSSYYAIYNASAATFKLTSGTISGIYRAIGNNQTGTTTIAGGTVKATGTTSSTDAIYNYGTLNITGGTITSGYNGICGNHGTLNITGGSITSGWYGIYNYFSSLVIGSNDSTVSSTSPVISGGTYGIYNYGTVSFYDGTIKGTDSEVYYGTITNIESLYSITKTTTPDSDGYYTATLTTSGVASIGTTEYSTLTEAIAAVPTDGTKTTINMLKNVSGITYTIESGKNIVLDLSGTTITSTGTTITNNGTLEVKDSSNDQTGIISTTSSSSSEYAIDNKSDGTFTLTNGKVEAKYEAIRNYYTGTMTIAGGIVTTTEETLATVAIHNYGYPGYKGTLNITGGSITSGGYGIYNYYSSLVIGSNDSTVSSTSPVISGYYGIGISVGTVNFYDGTIRGKVSDIYDGTIATIPDLYNINKTTSTDSEGYYSATLTTSYVASIGTTGYYTLTNAIAAVPTDGTETTIVMLNNTSSTTYTIASGQNVILDLNGKTITSTGTTITNNGTLKIQDSGTTGTVSSTSSYGIYNKGSLNVIAGTILSSNTYGIYSATGELEIGNRNNSISNEIPIIAGDYGIYGNSKTIYFSDGIIKGKNSGVYNIITIAIPENSEIIKSTSADSDGYYTAILSEKQ